MSMERIQITNCWYERLVLQFLVDAVDVGSAALTFAGSGRDVVARSAAQPRVSLFGVGREQDPERVNTQRGAEGHLHQRDECQDDGEHACP
jgi:hypothetical protein